MLITEIMTIDVGQKRCPPLEGQHLKKIHQKKGQKFKNYLIKIDQILSFQDVCVLVQIAMLCNTTSATTHGK